MGIPRRQMHREDRGALVMSDRCLTIVAAQISGPSADRRSFLTEIFGTGCARSCVIPLLSQRSQVMAELDEKMFAFYYELSSNSR
jgi:hypothetical protein